VNGSCHDVPKELIVSHLLVKRIFAMSPTLAAKAGNEESRMSRIGINDKFHLINVVFSEVLHRKAMTSEEAASHAELDTGLVGHPSSFWQLVYVRFHEGSPPESTNRSNFLDKVQHMHPLFHFGTFTAEKLNKA
jgi:hypothetical protein